MTKLFSKYGVNYINDRIQDSEAAIKGLKLLLSGKRITCSNFGNGISDWFRLTSNESSSCIIDNDNDEFDIEEILYEQHPEYFEEFDMSKVTFDFSQALQILDKGGKVSRKAFKANKIISSKSKATMTASDIAQTDWYEVE